jgi:hypothetical protein
VFGLLLYVELTNKNKGTCLQTKTDKSPMNIYNLMISIEVTIDWRLRELEELHDD